ncbi:MAG: ubiquinol-cytochrome c reductase iron-sulfur subunit [Halobacteriaceae archaeon]
MSESDKYPEASGRRRFVKGVVGSATLAAVGTTGAVTIDSVTSPSGGAGGQMEYFGIENTDGPAPRAMPMLPVEIDDEGFLKGVYPEVSEETTERGETVTVVKQELGGTTYSVRWFQYCGVQGYEGISPGYEGDNYFRYSSGYDWQPETGQRVNVEDFADYAEWGNGIGSAGIGKPAKVTWRSQDVENTIPVQILRTDLLSDVIADATGEAAEWLEAVTQNDFMAWLNKCTHFCCVPGYKTTEQSAQFGAEDESYCPCHQSVYDPYSIVKKRFVPFPRPEEG